MPRRRTATKVATLAAPALLLPIAAAVPLARTLPEPLALVVPAAPLVVFGGGALLALLTRRGRLVLGLVVVALADLALVTFGGRPIFAAVALLLPLNLGVIAWLDEESPLTARGAARLGVIVLQAALVLLIHRLQPTALTAILDPALDGLNVWTALPLFAVIAFVATLGAVVARFFVARRPLGVGAAWALVASFIALDAAGSGGTADLHFATAGMLLAVGAVLEPRRVAYLDYVTGLPANIELKAMLRRLPRHYALARVDIDDFLTFREAHGPEASRGMLRLVGQALAKVGGGGQAFYCEAHRFAVVFKRASAKAAERHLDRVRHAIEGATLELSVPERKATSRSGEAAARQAPPRRPARAVTVSVTISAGVAEAKERGVDPNEVLREADRALDRAKQAGMNRIST